MPNPECCQICGAAVLETLEGFSRLGRVTSDCRPWPAGGRLALCPGCGTVQKPADADWQSECATIYRDYAVYSLAGGAEQLVFDAAAGAAASRSSAIIARLLETMDLPVAGSVLDIGCGNGGFLAAFANHRPGWALHGAELDERNRNALEQIPGFQRLYVGDIGTIQRRFDLVVMIHALEHIPNPVAFLRQVREQLLTPEGWLVIEVPDHATNPFDLLIADHLVHFTTPVLGQALVDAGFAPLALTNRWVPKENTAVARPAGVAAAVALPEAETAIARSAVRQALGWLAGVAAAAETLAETGPIGVFGTAIAASWLAGRLGERVAFFVDEDPQRVGRSYLGRPVLAPSTVPMGADIVLPLAPGIADKVAARLNDGIRHYHVFSPPLRVPNSTKAPCP